MKTTRNQDPKPPSEIQSNPNLLQCLVRDGKLLGEGGYGKVYGLGGKCYKVMMAPIDAVHEAEMTRKAKGYGLEKVFVYTTKGFPGFCDYPSRDYWIMVSPDVYNGGTLSDDVSKPKYPLQYKEKVRLFLELTDQLAKLHECNITHNDIKPPNIMFHTPADGNGKLQLVLVDYGLADAANAESKFSDLGRLIDACMEWSHHGFLMSEKRCYDCLEYQTLHMKISQHYQTVVADIKGEVGMSLRSGRTLPRGNPTRGPTSSFCE